MITGLRDKGNTLLVVEHEEAVIRTADHLVDIGPGEAPVVDVVILARQMNSQTWIHSQLIIWKGKNVSPIPKRRRKPEMFVELRGVRHHNLRNVNFENSPWLYSAPLPEYLGSGKHPWFEMSFIDNWLVRKRAKRKPRDSGPISGR